MTEALLLCSQSGIFFLTRICNFKLVVFFSDISFDTYVCVYVRVHVLLMLK